MGMSGRSGVRRLLRVEGIESWEGYLAAERIEEWIMSFIPAFAFAFAL